MLATLLIRINLTWKTVDKNIQEVEREDFHKPMLKVMVINVIF